MRSALFFLLFAGCNPLSPYRSLECEWRNATYTGDELESRLTEYEWARTDPATVTLEFENYSPGNASSQNNQRPTAQISVLAPDFLILSSEVNSEGWIDMNGEPLENVTFSLNGHKAKQVDEGLFTYFDEEGDMSFVEGDNVWMHIDWPPEHNVVSTNIWITSFGWEEEGGTCSLVR